MDVSLDLYKIFCTVVRQGNMSSAAKELYISQPAVSMSIKQLEDVFGKPLLVRSSKGIKTTTEGSVIYEYLNQALSLIDTAEKKYLEMANLETGEVRIGASDTIISCYLLPYVEKYMLAHSNINIKVTNRTTYETIRLLKSGIVDIGFVNLPIQLDDSIDVYECKSIHDCLVGGPKFRHLAVCGVTLKDLASYPLMLLERDSNTRVFLDSFAAEHGVMLDPNIELGSSELLTQFAKINLGMTFLIREFLKPEIEKGLLYEIPLLEKIPKRSIGLIKLKDVALSYSATRFANFLNLNI